MQSTTNPSDSTRACGHKRAFDSMTQRQYKFDQMNDQQQAHKPKTHNQQELFNDIQWRINHKMSSIPS